MADYSLVYRTVLTVTVGDDDIIDGGGGLFYKDFALPASVKPGSTFIQQACREARIPTVPEPSLTLESRGALVRLLDEDTLRLEWFGELANDPEAGDEKIAVSVEVFDIDRVGNDLRESLYRQQRILGYLGENTRQDLLDYDDAGNIRSYRLRVFDSRANAEASTPELPDGEDLQTGELSRVRMTQRILTNTNDRSLLLKVLTDVLVVEDEE